MKIKISLLILLLTSCVENNQDKSIKYIISKTNQKWKELLKDKGTYLIDLNANLN